MSSEIIKGSRVEANRDLPAKFVKKGDKGTVSVTESFDSETYLHIKMDNGGYVSPICDNCWNLIETK